MKIHEYQAKELFRKYHITVPRGRVVFTPEEASAAAADLEGFPVALKAQIHAGGRGKGGGVKLAKSADEVRQFAGSLLGMTLVTRQTGPAGRKVRKILVEEGLSIERELYLSIIYDRSAAAVSIIASAEGGMDIEDVAASAPEKIIKVQVNPLFGIQPCHCRQVAYGLKLPNDVVRQLEPVLIGLYHLFTDYDCTLVEINPLVVTAKGGIVALDAKIEVDSNALFRQPEIETMRDIDEEDPLEAQAAEYHLNYIKLDGNVGNIVNGAGLAMATMDLIKKAGAEPANFLDVGGGATAEMVENGFRIILGDKNVRVVLINIFGGILRCDVLAKSLVDAAAKTGLDVPVIVRMEGTNVEEGRRILAVSGLNLIMADDLQDAASKVAELAAANS